MVRMLYDPEFARDVYADRALALAGDDLSARERDWLVTPDPRAYRTDPLRRSRTLAALMEELSTASALVLRRGREGSVRPETELLDAFFSSSFFHRCIRDGGAMIFAFADYLADGPPGGVAADRRVKPLARLERTIARVRRAAPPGAKRRAQSPMYLALAPWAGVLGLPAGTSELHHRVSRALRARGRTVLESLLDRRWSLPVLVDLSPEPAEHLLVEKTPHEEMPWAEVPVRYAPVTPELYVLLQAAATTVAAEDLAAKALELGAEPGAETAVIANLIDDGLLVPAGEPATPDRR
jgi:hypothetical protein